MGDPRSYPGAPRWVKALGLVVVVLVLLVVVIGHLFGGGHWLHRLHGG
jgi:hypothetical protein